MSKMIDKRMNHTSVMKPAQSRRKMDNIIDTIIRSR